MDAPHELSFARPVKITGGTGPFDWTLQVLQDDGTTTDDTRTITGTANLYDLNGAAHAVDEIVWIRYGGRDTSGNPFYVIVGGGGGAVIPITVVSDSGDGTLATPYTYTLKNRVTGATLKNSDGTDATGLSPRFARQQFAVTTAATNGRAFLDENGDWVLDDCDEVYERCA